MGLDAKAECRGDTYGETYGEICGETFNAVSPQTSVSFEGELL